MAKTEKERLYGPGRTLKIMKGAERKELLRKGEKGVLLLHGFKGCPSEMALLGDRLYAEGFSVLIPRYPGHGTRLEEMTKSSVKEWFRCARESYLELASRCSDLSVVGLSMGGLFAAALGAEFAPRRLVLISTPHSLKQKHVVFAPLLAPFIKLIPSPDTKLGINDPESRSSHVCYRGGNPVMQSFQLFCFAGKVRSLLSEIKTSTLIIQSKQDSVIPKGSLDYFYRKIGSEDKRTLWFEKSGHNIPMDYDREELGSRIVDFLG